MFNLKHSLESLLSEALVQATQVSDARGNVIYSSRPEFGDYQANGVMAVAKQLKMNPRELAQKVVSLIPENEFIARAEVAGPGFINLFLKDASISRWCAHFAQQDTPLLSPSPHPQTVVVDYSSPNLAKEMHVGHLRGTIIGDCIVRVLEACGHQVIRQNHVGDWGTQFGMLIAHMESLQSRQTNLSTALSDLESFYREAKQRFDNEPGFADLARSYVVKLQQGDTACLNAWKIFIDESLAHCEEVYQKLGVTLKREDIKAESFYNSELNNIIEALDAVNLLQISDGAKCVFLDEFIGKDGTPLPAIVQKSDGGFLYATTDLAAIRHRSQKLKADRVLYVVDARQSLHFQQVFAIAKRAGFTGSHCSLEHIAYGTMMGEDGKPFKTRSGDTIKLIDLLDEGIRQAFEIVNEKNPELDIEQRRSIASAVGISAVKYSDLSKNRTSDYIFDWKTMLSFEGNTAPYMLYAYARIKSILRKQDIHLELTNSLHIKEQEERNLALKILQYQETVQSVAQDAYPNTLCSYLYELAGIFMRFYEACPVLKAEADIRTSRLILVSLTAKILSQGLELLGLKSLEKM